MQSPSRMRLVQHILPVVLAVSGLSVTAGGPRPDGKSLAPHEQSPELAPPAIDWPAPPLPTRAVEFESAEERKLRLIVMTKGLEQPWSIAFLPDGALLITERPGRLRIVRHGVLDPDPVAGVPPVATGGVRGLMDVALHPHFSDNQWIYLAYHKPVANGGETTLARGRWNGHALLDVREIFVSGATETEASRIAFGRDGMLYMSVSAPGNGPHVARSQDPNDYAGKVVRLRDDGTVPADGPFVGRRGHKPAVFTTGHRNGHALAVNPETGELWETEQGPNGGDEINILRAGKNYGWPIVSYGRDYWGPRISARPTRAGMEDPIIVWLPSIGLTGMTFYTADRFPHWKRNLFVAGLREGGIPRTGQIQRIEFNDNWEELRREPMLTDLHQRIRDIRQGPDGLLYILTAENEGALLRIEPK
jgi:glucose/arabinose dehydrogenase